MSVISCCDSNFYCIIVIIVHSKPEGTQKHPKDKKPSPKKTETSEARRQPQRSPYSSLLLLFRLVGCIFLPPPLPFFVTVSLSTSRSAASSPDPCALPQSTPRKETRNKDPRKRSKQCPEKSSPIWDPDAATSAGPRGVRLSLHWRPSDRLWTSQSGGWTMDLPQNLSEGKSWHRDPQAKPLIILVATPPIWLWIYDPGLQVLVTFRDAAPTAAKSDWYHHGPLASSSALCGLRWWSRE